MSYEKVNIKYKRWKFMIQNRKDDHINYALEQEKSENSFDDMELIHQSIFLQVLRIIILKFHFLLMR